MSFALTTDQIRRREKTVTRRLGWTFLKPGDHIRAVVKAQGLKKGEKVTPLGALRVVSVRREPLRRLTDDMTYGYAEIEREGFRRHPEWGWPAAFVAMFCRTHPGCTPDSKVTRIAFEYVTAGDDHAHARRAAGPTQADG